MYDPSAERIRAVNRTLLYLFFATLALSILMLISMVGVLAEALAETDMGRCEGSTRASSRDAVGADEGAKGIFRGVLAALPQAADGITYAVESAQRPVMRDGWSQGHLVLVVDYAPQNAGACDRHVFVSTKRERDLELSGEWVTGQPGDSVVLTSFEEAAYLSDSYGKELKACGDLIVYGLSSGPGSGMFGEQTPRALSALADMLREEPMLKVRVVGHRASSGNPANDYALSADDAEAVKRMLVLHYGTEPKRISAEGAGSEEPIADNDTVTGRAANSRIEIVAERSCERSKEPVIAGHRESTPAAEKLVTLGAVVH
jgi:hypothetical protein